MLSNHDPGLHTLEVWVNSKLQSTVSLTPSETLNLDVTAAMTWPENTISLVGFGELASRAHIIITDSTPGDYPVTPEVETLTPTRIQSGAHSRKRSKTTPASRHASSATHTIQLNLSDALASGISSDPSLFYVKVHRKLQIVQGVAVEPGPGGTTNLTLSLLPDSFDAGDAVYVYWHSLPDAHGGWLSGLVPLLAK